MVAYTTILLASPIEAYVVSSNVFTPWLGQPSFLRALAALWATQTFAWLVWRVILYPKFFSPLIGLPEPSTGNSWFMGQWKAITAFPTGTPMIKWMNTIPNEGIIRYLGPFNQERLLITTPKGLSEVLTTKSYDFIKPQMLRYSLGRILGIGLLLAEGDEHKLQRKNLMPAFSFRHIKDLYSVFWSKGREGVQAIMEEIKDKAAQSDGKATAVIEASSWASRITLDIIGVAGMGRDFEAIKNPNNRLTQAYNRVFKPSVQARILQLLGLIVNPRFLSWVPLQRNKDLEDAAKIIRAECHELINEKKRKLAQSKLDDVDILSVALTSGGFSDSNLVDQLMTFLAAGHETTASALTWAIYLLAKNPEMQSRLRAEVRAHLPPLGNPGDDDQNSTVTSVDIDRLPYLNAVCNEVLRYFPPAPLTLRRAARDTTICGVHIPKNTQVMVVPWAINRSRALWGDDAEVFNPDRWMPASEGDSKRPAGGGAVSNYAFLTFLHGPRSCIGQAFAKSEFACLLATWVGRLSWELENKEEMDESKLQIRGGVTARPANGMWIRATVVEGW